MAKFFKSSYIYNTTKSFKNPSFSVKYFIKKKKALQLNAKGLEMPKFLLLNRFRTDKVNISNNCIKNIYSLLIQNNTLIKEK